MKKTGAAIDTPAARQLEAERVAAAFAQISKSWWWFNEADRLAHEDNPVSWQWELLRRSQAYRDFVRRADAIRVRDSADPSFGGFMDAGHALGELRKLAASHSRLGDADPCPRWADLFMAGCSPDLSWAQLPEQARSRTTQAAPLFPRAEHAVAFTGSFGPLQTYPVIVRRRQDGTERITPVIKEFIPVTHDGSVEFATTGKLVENGSNAVTLGRLGLAPVPILPKRDGLGAYLVIVFDARFTRHILTLLQNDEAAVRSSWHRALETLGLWFKLNPGRTPAVPRKSSARVLPSNMPFWCHAWIPTDDFLDCSEVLSRFCTLLRPSYKRKWLRRCKKTWRALDPSHIPDSLGPLKTKPAHLKSKTDLEAGLCALDCRQIEPRFTPQGPLIRLLQESPCLERLADPDLLRDAMKQVSRLIRGIDTFYRSTRATR